MRATSRAVSSRDPHPSVAEEVLGELPLDPLCRRLHRRQQIADGPHADPSYDDAAAPATSAAGPAEAAHVSSVAVVAGAVAIQCLRNMTLEFDLKLLCMLFVSYDSYVGIQ